MIMALDTYFRIQPRTPDPNLPEVTELSSLLKQFPRAHNEERDARYRSAASVVMKLMNFRSIDPAYQGEGLRAIGKADQETWDEFAGSRERLANAANAILTRLAASSRPTSRTADDTEMPKRDN